MNRIDDLCINCSFMLDGHCHTILDFRNGMAVTEREDGRTVYLHGWEKPEEWKARGSLKNWLSRYSPTNI